MITRPDAPHGKRADPLGQDEAVWGQLDRAATGPCGRGPAEQRRRDDGEQETKHIQKLTDAGPDQVAAAGQERSARQDQEQHGPAHRWRLSAR